MASAEGHKTWVLRFPTINIAVYLTYDRSPLDYVKQVGLLARELAVL